MDEGSEKPNDKLAGLTKAQKEELDMIKKMLDISGGTKHTEFREFVVGQQRLRFLATNSLKRLQGKDPGLYQQVATWMHFGYQNFLDAITTSVRLDAETQEKLRKEGFDPARIDVPIPHEGFRAEKMLQSPEDLALSGLGGNESFDMREKMIHWLEDKPNGKEFQSILKELQVLMPKRTEMDDSEL